MNLSDLIRVYPSIVARASCLDVIRAFEENFPKTSISRYETDLYRFDQANVNQVWPELANDFAGFVAGLAKGYFAEIGVKDFIGVQSFEEVRIKKYLKGQGEFRPHIDVDDLASAKRYLIAMLYLNDNNGVTTFPNLNIQITPKAGDIVMFPPMWMFPHAGTMPTDTDKYIMMTSLTYV